VRTRLALCLAIAAVASVGAGCGGDDGDSDQEAITAVLNELRSVQDSGDAKTACSEVYVIQEGQQRAGEIAAEASSTTEADSGETDAGEADAGEADAGEGDTGEADAGEGEADAGEGGESPAACEQAFEAAYERRRAEVKDLTTEIGSIEVDGDRATATVHTQLQRLDGSMLTQDVPYDLVRTPDGWRVRIADEG
jgi:hypothetical protein